LRTAGRAPKIAQGESKATYGPACTQDETRNDWHAPADPTYNLTRGSNPQPDAITSLNGAKLKIFYVERVPEAVGAPGAVLAVDDAGVLVAMSAGGVRLKRVTPEGQGKIAAAEWAHTAGVTPGARLGG